MGKKRLTASKRESLLRLNIALEILAGEPEHLAQRSAMVPGAKRDMAMMAAKIHKLLEGFTETIPDDQLMMYRRSLQMATFTIGIRRPGGTPRNEQDYGMWLPYWIINELLAGLHDKCLMCSLDKGQRRGCSLKKALDTIPNDAALPEDGDCAYYTLI